MIHPTAIVDPRAEIDSTAEVGPYAIIEGPVRIGARTRLRAHSIVIGPTELGSENDVHYGAVLGDIPQDLAYSGADTRLTIGDGNVFREYCAVHRGTKPGTETVIGHRNYFMTHSHVGHNCRIGNDTIMATGAVLGGYVELGERSFVSGNCVVHQFVRVGRLSLLRGLSKTSRDVPPFCIMDWTHTVRAVNVIGLRRAGYSAAEIQALRGAFRTLFLRRRNLKQALDELEAGATSPSVRELIDFIRESKRGVCFGPRGAAFSEDAAEE